MSALGKTLPSKSGPVLSFVCYAPNSIQSYFGAANDAKWNF